MNCIDFVDKISLYIDDELTEIEKKEFELHILKCDNCRQEYEDMINILKNVRNQEQVELPDNYRFELRRKLKEVAKEEKKINWRVISSVAAGLIIMLISISMFLDNTPFSGETKSAVDREESENQQENIAFDTNKAMEIIGDESTAGIKAKEDSSKKEIHALRSAPSENKANIYNAPSENEANIDKSPNSPGIMASRSNLGNSRKSVKDAYLCIEVDQSNLVEEKIRKYVEENSGYIENLNIESNEKDTEATQKNYLIKIRIPSDKFDQTLDFLKKLGRTLDEQSMHNDVTEEYYRIEANLKSLYDQENLLLEILNKAENTKDKLLVEEELKKVKEKINSELSALEEIDSSINLSTINTKLSIADEENN